ncbi:hypothetical protein RDV64_13220 [Acuticoccus sp. MNP-M23]|uniref:hypothetical protein n=1 Tax=Acuticoccus sp. MNP-M23 TaxID=3072793 RepID=UPI0028159D8C|nr:hypothetical protein [Acuticoccus sp. MNP-M23]WMS41046.1 hypothetical protein RDV64_13220 [Acuticoccus sp. MNP-M23]
MPEQSEVTLYIGLERGYYADLEVVGEAAAAWARSVKAAARAINAEFTVQIKLESMEEGSLKLNALLDWGEEQLDQLKRGSGRYPLLSKTAMAMAVFLIFTAGPTYLAYESYFSSEGTELSDEDRERMDELIELLRRDDDVEEQSQQFFRTLERDTHIQAVGLAPERSTVPIALVNRNQFAELGGLFAREAETDLGLTETSDERIRRSEKDVILISPVLENKPRSWKFREEGFDPFTAVMRDKNFLAALENANIREDLRANIRMTIILELKERKVGGVWELRHKGRSVLRVLDPKVPVPDLFRTSGPEK